MNRLRLVSAAVACALIVSGAPTMAAGCTASSAGVAFGSYDTLSDAPLDGAGTISINCDVSTSFTVALSSGSGSSEERQMAAGTSQLSYNLYTDATRVVVWGDGVSGSTVSATGDAVNLTVYGRVPPLQNVVADVYSDTITITVSF